MIWISDFGRKPLCKYLLPFCLSTKQRKGDKDGIVKGTESGDKADFGGALQWLKIGQYRAPILNGNNTNLLYKQHVVRLYNYNISWSLQKILPVAFEHHFEIIESKL